MLIPLIDTFIIKASSYTNYPPTLEAFYVIVSIQKRKNVLEYITKVQKDID